MILIKRIRLLLVLFIIIACTIKVSDVIVGMVLEDEKIVGEWGNRYVSLREIPPNYNGILYPTDEYIDGTNGLQQKDYRIRTSKDGFIVGPGDIEGKRAHADRSIDLIFFGGSTTESMYVDESFRFPYLVGRKLNNKDGEPLVVLNGGYSGNHSFHSLLSFLAKGIPKKPDYVVLMNVVNDVALLSKTGTYWKSPNSRAIVKKAENDAMNGRLYNVLYAAKEFFIPNIWSIIRPLLIGFVNDNIVRDEWYEFRGDKKSFQEIRMILEGSFRASIVSFVSVSREWGIEPILMTQFNRYNIGDEYSENKYLSKKQPIDYVDFVSLYDLANNIVRDVAAQKKVFLIDLEKEDLNSSTYLYDTVHLNDDGSKKVAAIIAESLLSKYSDKFLISKFYYE